MAPTKFFLHKEDEAFRRLVSAYGASENATFVHLDSTRCYGSPIVNRCSLLI